MLSSGFVVLMAWMAWKALAGMPAGDGLGLVGAGIFLVGGWARNVAGPFPAPSYTRQHGVASVLVTNLLLVAPVLLLRRRWRPPFGSATLLFTIVTAMTTATQELAHGELVLAALAGGLAADWSIAWSSRTAGPTGAHRLVATITPLALWTSYFLVLQLRDGIAWPAELWTGSVIFAA